MALRALLDTVVTVYRSPQTIDGYGDTDKALAPVLTGVNVAFHHATRMYSRDSGGGDELTGHITMFFEPKWDIREGDIVTITSGVSPSWPTWIVRFIYNPRGKVPQATVSQYTAPLPS